MILVNSDNIIKNYDTRGLQKKKMNLEIFSLLPMSFGLNKNFSNTLRKRYVTADYYTIYG